MYICLSVNTQNNADHNNMISHAQNTTALQPTLCNCNTTATGHKQMTARTIQRKIQPGSTEKFTVSYNKLLYVYINILIQLYIFVYIARLIRLRKMTFGHLDVMLLQFHAQNMNPLCCKAFTIRTANNRPQTVFTYRIQMTAIYFSFAANCRTPSRLWLQMRHPYWGISYRLLS